MAMRGACRAKHIAATIHPTAYWFFCLSFAISAAVLSLALMCLWPPPGVPRTTFAACMCDGGRGRALACAAGLVCGIGNGAQFLGGAAVGFAASRCKP